MITQDNPLVKTLPLINNEKIVGNLQLSFNLQTFSDTSFDDDIKSLTQFGIQNEVLNTLNNRAFYDSEIFKSKKNIRPITALSSKTNRSKEELACDYLMGKLLVYCYLALLLQINIFIIWIMFRQRYGP